MPGGFRIGWIIVLAVIAVQAYGLYFEERGEEPRFRRPPPSGVDEWHPPKVPRMPHQDRGTEVLPKPSARDRVFTIETGPKSNSTGSAFAIHEDGIWVTARHVVDGCDRVGLVVAPRSAIEVERVLAHPRADIAVIWAQRSAPAISISAEELRERQPGFHFGFPKGQPGQVSSSLLGRRNMRTVGRYRQIEPVVAWAEHRRIPSTDALGGISGGPAINAAGEIVGVTVAASQRRGRVYTTAPATLQAMLDLAGVRPAGAPSARLATGGPQPANFVEYGSALRDQLTVAKVICRVRETRRRPRRI